MKVTYIEREAGVWRLRIETGRSAPTVEHPHGERKFAYEVVRGVEDDARRRRFEVLRAHEEGSFAVPSRLTVAGFLGRPLDKPKEFGHWVAQRVALGMIGRSTAENYQVTLDSHVVPVLGAIALQKLTAHDVQAVYTGMLKAGLHSSTVHLHRILRVVFKDARKTGLVVVNIMDAVQGPKAIKIAPKATDAAGMARVLEACEGDWKWAPAMVGFGAGLRLGEVLGLRRMDVDLDGARLHVRGQLIKYRDGTLDWVKPKTAAGARTIAISAELVGVLRKVMQDGLEARMRGGIGRDGLDEAPVFSRDGASWIKPAALSQEFSALCDRIGLSDFTFHGTRHTHGTALLKRVGPSGAKAVSQRLGHANIKVTLEVYQTVFEEDDRQLADMQGPISRRLEI
jgi:integrase